MSIYRVSGASDDETASFLLMARVASPGVMAQAAMERILISWVSARTRRPAWPAPPDRRTRTALRHRLMSVPFPLAVTTIPRGSRPPRGPTAEEAAVWRPPR